MTDQQRELIEKLLQKYQISADSLEKTLVFLGVGYGLSENQIEQYLSLKNGTLLEKHALMMSFVQAEEKSDVDMDDDRDSDADGKQSRLFSLWKKRKTKQKKNVGNKNKETYEELSRYILETGDLSAAQIEQLRLAAKAGMSEEDVLKLAKGGKGAMEIRKCVEFYEMVLAGKRDE